MFLIMLTIAALEYVIPFNNTTYIHMYVYIYTQYTYYVSNGYGLALCLSCYNRMQNIFAKEMLSIEGRVVQCESDLFLNLSGNQNGDDEFPIICT